ncbi:MAG: adenine-specific methyltransferase EcoRI family protein [Desulfovibrio sp.]|jgi:hypothetical protein|nr:adenine-specific methyltransferase EcoRI family protein [Desulfovibrio sp.]
MCSFISFGNTTYALNAAKQAASDEFYTLLKDIKKELQNYKEIFFGKTILCNCDDPYESNFFKFFVMHFNDYNIKKLIATSYKIPPFTWKALPLECISGKEYFASADKTIKYKQRGIPYKVEVNKISDVSYVDTIENIDVDSLIRNESNAITKLNGDGDFRSEEYICILEQADI